MMAGNHIDFEIDSQSSKLIDLSTLATDAVICNKEMTHKTHFDFARFAPPSFSPFSYHLKLSGQITNLTKDIFSYALLCQNLIRYRSRPVRLPLHSASTHSSACTSSHQAPRARPHRSLEWSFTIVRSTCCSTQVKPGQRCTKGSTSDACRARHALTLFLHK
jgi:hypothetical protein